jgi:hypothetical protein
MIFWLTYAGVFWIRKFVCTASSDVPQLIIISVYVLYSEHCVSLCEKSCLPEKRPWLNKLYAWFMFNGKQCVLLSSW